MGFWGGFIEAAGNQARQRDLMEMQQASERKTALVNHLTKMFNEARPEAAGLISQRLQKVMGTPAGKLKDKDFNLSDLLMANVPRKEMSPIPSGYAPDIEGGEGYYPGYAKTVEQEIPEMNIPITRRDTGETSNVTVPGETKQSTLLIPPGERETPSYYPPSTIVPPPPIPLGMENEQKFYRYTPEELSDQEAQAAYDKMARTFEMQQELKETGQRPRMTSRNSVRGSDLWAQGITETSDGFPLQGPDDPNFYPVIGYEWGGKPYIGAPSAETFSSAGAPWLSDTGEYVPSLRTNTGRMVPGQIPQGYQMTPPTIKEYRQHGYDANGDPLYYEIEKDPFTNRIVSTTQVAPTRSEMERLSMAYPFKDFGTYMEQVPQPTISGPQRTPPSFGGGAALPAAPGGQEISQQTTPQPLQVPEKLPEHRNSAAWTRAQPPESQAAAETTPTLMLDRARSANPQEAAGVPMAENVRLPYSILSPEELLNQPLFRDGYDAPGMAGSDVDNPDKNIWSAFGNPYGDGPINPTALIDPDLKSYMEEPGVPYPAHLYGVPKEIVLPSGLRRVIKNPRALTAQQAEKMRESREIYNTVVSQLTYLSDHADVLSTVTGSLRMMLATATQSDFKMFAERLAGNYIFPLDKQKADVANAYFIFAANYNNLSEHVQVIRTPLGAAGFRSLDAFKALQAQRGSIAANPEITRVLVRNTLKTVLALKSSVEYALACDNSARDYVHAKRNTPTVETRHNYMTAYDVPNIAKIRAGDAETLRRLGVSTPEEGEKIWNERLDRVDRAMREHGYVF